MPQDHRTIIMIPARMASTRLPDKPMELIDGLPMICQVYQRCVEANIGVPWVATDSRQVFDAIISFGGKAVMTREDHPSGSDRIWEAVTKIDPDEKIEFIVNVQGDLPTICGDLIRQSIQPLIEDDLESTRADIATLGVEITDEAEKTNSNVVKIIGSPIAHNRQRAIYFTRATAPWGEGKLFHHIGLYAYRRAALKKFVLLGPSHLESREKLEQLRAIEAGMRIDVSIVKTIPLGVDTQEDLETARNWFQQQKQDGMA